MGEWRGHISAIFYFKEKIPMKFLGTTFNFKAVEHIFITRWCLTLLYLRKSSTKKSNS